MLQQINWLIALPGLGVSLSIIVNLALEQKANWRILFIGHTLLITAILMSGCLYVVNINSEVMYEGRLLESFCSTLMLKYGLILFCSLILVRQFLWNKNEDKPSLWGFVAFMAIGVYALIDLTMFIIKVSE